MVRALGRAWGGQLISLVSILGCDNTKHPLGLARRCLVNLFFWRWEKTWGHPESEERQARGWSGQPTWLSGQRHWVWRGTQRRLRDQPGRWADFPFADNDASGKSQQ